MAYRTLAREDGVAPGAREVLAGASALGDGPTLVGRDAAIGILVAPSRTLHPGSVNVYLS